ncbi:hypothetical protein MMC08_006355 [Hypocenomyce scalaris]|nr:hypothetical protein [Hypocenomyce scalaris]
MSGLDKFMPRIELSYTSYFIVVYSLCLIPALAIAMLALRDRWSEEKQLRGCRKLGLRAQSNLADERDTKYRGGTESAKDEHGNNTWRVKSLWIFPVKSCRGIELNRGTVVSTGMEYDRQFSFAQLRSPFPVSADTPKSEKAAHQWKFITQREFPLLARVETEVWVPDPSSSTYSTKEPFVQSGGALVMTYPFEEDGWRGLLPRLIATFGGSEPHKSVTIPFSPTAEQIKTNGYTMEQMTIWKDSPEALNMGASLPPELKFSIGVRNPLALFRVATEHERQVFRCAPRKEQLGYQPITGFADAYPLHILNLASVQDVATRLQEGAPKLSALRFRSNIIITGPGKYIEDSWKRIRIGEYIYYVTCRTTRCKLPNTDQNTGVKHPVEPEKTLKSFRCIDEGAAEKACLGMQMVPALEESKIKVGDLIEVLETGEHYYIK